MLKKCEDCFHLEKMRKDIDGYCMYPFLDDIPNNIHNSGFIFNIHEEHNCKVFELNNEYIN